MKRMLVVSVFLVAGASAAGAAEIHGTVSDAGKPVPKAVALKLDCGGTTAQATTDEFGSYTLKITATGECRLTVDYQGGTASLGVSVYDRPSRYDLAVAKQDGKLVLSRK